MPNSISTLPAALQLPVEVVGADLNGQQFFERAQTVTIHRNGVLILLANTLAPDSEVILRNPETSEEATGLVVGQAREDDSGHVYGLTFLDPAANIWNLQFPAPGSARTVQLECETCHSGGTHSLSDIEMEIFQGTHELTRLCKKCNTDTVWKERRREVSVQKPGSAPSQDPNPGVIASRIEERRGSRRTAMKTMACIRFSGMEFVVACEDISKGGFRFISSREYPAETRLEAAVPYTKFSTNIFSLAEIIYCDKLPDGQFRHGVTYISTPGSIGWDP